MDDTDLRLQPDALFRVYTVLHLPDDRQNIRCCGGAGGVTHGLHTGFLVSLVVVAVVVSVNRFRQPVPDSQKIGRSL